MLKLFVFVPDHQEIIDKVMTAATKAGAGIIGNYTGCGFTTKGTGNWKSEEGSNPTIGEVGVYSHEPEVRIEMICPEKNAALVKKAILEVHPYEEPEIDFIQLVDVAWLAYSYCTARVPDPHVLHCIHFKPMNILKPLILKQNCKDIKKLATITGIFLSIALTSLITAGVIAGGMIPYQDPPAELLMKHDAFVTAYSPVLILSVLVFFVSFGLSSLYGFKLLRCIMGRK